MKNPLRKHFDTASEGGKKTREAKGDGTGQRLPQ